MSAEYVLVIGAVISLLLTELVGISAGGVIVPGYFALYLDAPVRLAITLADAGAALVVVRLMSRKLVLFGRRRYACFLLAGFLARYATERLTPAIAPGVIPEAAAFTAVGWLIPGILAADADRQGPVRTALALVASALFVRLIWVALG